MNLRALKDALRLVVPILTVVLLSQDCTAGIERTAKRWYMLDLYGGTSMAQGEYDGLWGDRFFIDTVLVLPSDSVYEEGLFLGASYALLRSNWLFGLGFRYTNIIYRDTIFHSGPNQIVPEGFYNPSQWDFDIYLHYYPVDLSKGSASPYFGVAVLPGLTSVTASGYKSSNVLTFALSLDFGADIKIASGAGERSFVTISSVNSYQFVGTNDRPKYLNVGVGLKYFFRP